MPIRCLLVIISACILSRCGGEEFYTAEDFYTVNKFDTHTHPNTDNPAFVEQALADNFRILAVNVDAPHYPSLDEQQAFSLVQKAAGPDHVEFLTTISVDGWETPHWAENEINRVRAGFAKGALGIKLWKNIGMVEKDSTGHFIMVDDPRFDPLIKFIIEQDKTVLAHLGEPKNCWLPLDSMTVNGDRNYYKNNPQYHMFQHPEYPAYDELINARDRFVEKHPDLRFVGAHLGSLEWSVDELAKRFDRFPNMAVDMAARVRHLQYQSVKDRRKVRDFMIRYKDRLIYATDAGLSKSGDPDNAKKNLHERWMEDWKYFATDEIMTSTHFSGEFQGLQLPREVIDQIFYHNAVRWFKVPQ